LQADEASDQVILATEQIEDLNLTALEQQLQSKQDALQGKLIALQELQASLLHPVQPELTCTADTSSCVCGPTMCMDANTPLLILSLAHASVSFITLGHIAVCMLLDQCLQICNQKCVLFQNE